MIARTAVMQGPGLGDDYPFVGAAAESALFTDFYVYAEPSCDWTLPLRLARHVGFGSAGSPSAHAHAYDVRVTDAAGVTVFDTDGGASAAATDAWGDRRVTLWRGDGFVARAVWRPAAAGDFDYLSSPGLPLDPRTTHFAPLRLKSVAVGATVYTGDLVFKNGYNTAWTVRPAAPVDGRPFARELVLSASPGSGLGQAPGCVDPLPAGIRTVNGVRPGPGGLFTLATGDCHRAGNLDDAGSPGLQVRNDCTACRPCGQFDAVARAAGREFAAFWRLGREAEAAGALYHQNRARWLAARECRRARPAKLSLFAQPDCKMAVSAVFCNVTPCCLLPVEMRFTFRRLSRGAAAPAGTVVPYSGFVDSGATDGLEPYAVGGSWPVLRAFFTAVDPQTSAAAQFRLRDCGGCGDDEAIQAAVTVHAASPAANADGLPCDPPDAEAEVPGWARDAWDLAGLDGGDPVAAFAEKTAPLDPSPAGFNCSGCGGF